MFVVEIKKEIVIERIQWWQPIMRVFPQLKKPLKLYIYDCQPPFLFLSLHSFSLFCICTNIFLNVDAHFPFFVIYIFSFLTKRKHKRKGLIGLIPVLRTALRAPRLNVFMVMSVSSRQALEHRTQPHLIRTRLFDLLHYPVITQTGYWRTEGLALLNFAHNWGKISSNQSQTSIRGRGFPPIVTAALWLLTI